MTVKCVSPAQGVPSKGWAVVQKIGHIYNPLAHQPSLHPAVTQENLTESNEGRILQE